MKLKIWYLLVCVGLLCTSLTAEPLLITNLKGEVKNEHGHSLNLLARVDTEQTIVLLPGALVTLTSLQDGSRYTISGQSRAKVAEKGLVLLSGDPSQLARFKGRKVVDKEPKDISVSMGGQFLRSAPSTPRILSVGNLSEPVLHWERFPGALKYEVTVLEGGAIIENRVTEELSASLPLDADSVYVVILAAIVKDEADIVSDTVREVRGGESAARIKLLGDLPESALRLVHDTNSELYTDNTDTTEIAIVFSQLFDHQLYYDALKLLNNSTHHQEELGHVKRCLMKTIQEEQVSLP